MSDKFTHTDTSPTQEKTPRVRGMLLLGICFFAAILALSLYKRMAAHADVARWTDEQLIRSVSIVTPTAGNDSNLILPARLEAWAQAPVYARTSGYLKAWYADIGSKVTKDEVLADIDTPEVDHELAGARAALAKVQADLKLATQNVQRVDQLIKSQAISREDADQKYSSLQSLEAQAKQAQAEIERLETLSGFKRVVAPFDGIVTSRNTDVGALIDSSASSAPLFTIADASKLRLYVNVPESYVSDMKQGLTASFSIPEAPDRMHEARVEKMSGAIDPASGTMLVQLVVDNADGSLKPGAYAELNFNLKDAKTSLRVPASAIMFGKDGVALALLGPDDKAIIKPVKIGRDFGAEVEIADGLSAGDKIIDSPPDSLSSGDPVKPLVAEKAPAAK